MKAKTPSSQERGYIMLIVMVLLIILIASGTYGLKAVESEIRATSKFRKSELLGRAAEAGAAHRLAEISLIQDPIAILDETQSVAVSTWNNWPPAYGTPGAFTSPEASDVGEMFQYRSGPIQLLQSNLPPPPGIQAGTKAYIFEMTSYAVGKDQDSAGEASVSTGFKTWEPRPGSYAP